MVFEDVVEKAVVEKDRFIMQIYKEYCLSKGLNITKLAKKKKRFKKTVTQDHTETYHYKNKPIFKLQSQVKQGNDNSFKIVYNYEKMF